LRRPCEKRFGEIRDAGPVADPRADGNDAHVGRRSDGLAARVSHFGRGFFDDEVRIVAAKTKGADRCSPRKRIVPRLGRAQRAQWRAVEYSCELVE